MIEENKSISNLTNLFPLISQKHYEFISENKKRYFKLSSRRII